MKYLTLIFISLLFIACEKYQYIDETTRFNKTDGSIDVLLDDGNWISKSKRLKDVQYAKEMKELKEKQDQEAQLIIFPYEESENISGRGGFRTSTYSAPFIATIENNSNWKIEEIDIKIEIYSSDDSTYLTKRLFTGNSYGDNDGTPFTKTEYSGYVPQKEDNQYNTWTIMEVRGYKYEGK